MGRPWAEDVPGRQRVPWPDGVVTELVEDCYPELIDEALRKEASQIAEARNARALQGVRQLAVAMRKLADAFDVCNGRLEAMERRLQAHEGRQRLEAQARQDLEDAIKSRQPVPRDVEELARLKDYEIELRKLKEAMVAAQRERELEEAYRAEQNERNG